LLDATFGPRKVFPITIQLRIEKPLLVAFTSGKVVSKLKKSAYVNRACSCSPDNRSPITNPERPDRRCFADPPENTFELFRRVFVPRTHPRGLLHVVPIHCNERVMGRISQCGKPAAMLTQIVKPTLIARRNVEA